MMMMFKYLVLGLIALTASLQHVHANEETIEQRNLRKSHRSSRSSSSIVDIAVENEAVFSTLVDAVVATGLARSLNCKWWCYKYTVFAPTNDAFTALSNAAPDTFKKLTEDEEYSEHLRQLLLYHIVYGAVRSRNINNGDSIHSVQGEALEATIDNGNIKINSADVIKPFDVAASNGVIHTVDEVLLPSFVTQGIPAIASGASQFSELVKAVQAYGLLDTLQSDGPFTVFAPTDEAFGKVDLSTLSKEDIQGILKYHVVPGIYTAQELEDGKLDTAAGQKLDVSVERSGWRHWRKRSVTLNGKVPVTATNILASNGIIHEISEVLIPTTLRAASLPSIVDVVAGDENFSLLAGLLDGADLIDVLEDETREFTVFAPTNDAIEALLAEVGEVGDDVLKDILLYHVIADAKVLSSDLETSLVEAANGDNIAVEVTAKSGKSNAKAKLNGDTRITAFDIEASNGAIHVIDKVLIPNKKNIAMVAQDLGNFNILLEAVGAVDGLADVLAGGPFTVFAPTDEAFGKLEDGTLESLLQDPETLGKILTYHVVEGFVPFSALSEGKVPTVQGQDIDVDIRCNFWRRTQKEVLLNKNTKVESVDTLANNGVIHVIDSVLLPEL